MLVILAVPLVACLPAPVYQVQRSVRAPHATVPLRTGQPLLGPVELTVGASNATDVVKPRIGDAKAAVEVPERQLRGELRVRMRKNGELAFIHERGAGGSAIKLDPTQAPIGDGTPHGSGMAFRYAIPYDGKFALGLELELLSWQLPYVEYRTCVDNCDGLPNTTVEHGDAHEPTVGLGMTPSYQLDQLTIFGGAFARHHPTIVRKGTEYSPVNSDDVDQGKMNLLVHAGVAYRFAGGFSALLVVDQDLTADPVRYGPGVGLAVSAALR